MQSFKTTTNWITIHVSEQIEQSHLNFVNPDATFCSIFLPGISHGIFYPVFRSCTGTPIQAHLFKEPTVYKYKPPRTSKPVLHLNATQEALRTRETSKFFSEKCCRGDSERFPWIQDALDSKPMIYTLINVHVFGVLTCTILIF
jgi:hypothetical protein